MPPIRRLVFERTDTTEYGWYVIHGEDFDSLESIDQINVILKGWVKSGIDYYKEFKENRP